MKIHSNPPILYYMYALSLTFLIVVCIHSDKKNTMIIITKEDCKQDLVLI